MSDDKKSVPELLLRLGFSKQESATYLALLEMESVSIRKIAEQTGINRGTTYDSLKKLVAKGLVSMRRSGKREYYFAESPEKIYEIIRDKRRDLWQAQQLSRQIVPGLLAKNARPQGRPLVRYYEGDDGVVTILRDVLQTCRGLDPAEYRAYSSRQLRQYIYRRFPTFTARRIAEGIKVKVIAIGEGGEIAEASERKWLPEPADSGVASYTIIYGNKVAVIAISNDYTPYGVVIEDQGAASMQRLLFDSLWLSL
ncbi:MAG TPA: helix-turn-helix domain-containing protein [Candidatus Saccharimonadales bacterium]